MDKSKVEAVVAWPPPKNVRDLRGFLGLTGFYRRFCDSYAKVAIPLTNLLKADRPWQWEAEEHKAFEGLKKVLSKAPVLVIADPNNPKGYVLSTDASDFAIGAVLSQEQPDGTLRPVAFASRKLKPAERNIRCTSANCWQ